MNTKIRVAALAVAAALSGTSQAALYDRGGGLIYDSDLNVTWLQDANYAKTSGYDADGKMTWGQANTWAANLTYNDSVRGVTYTDWRLPNVTDVGTAGCTMTSVYNGIDCGYNVNTSTGEMAHIFYDELANKGWVTTTDVIPQPGWGLNNTGPFVNLITGFYWSGTQYAPNTTFAYSFNFGNGEQWRYLKSESFYAWAVRPGDIANVLPVPLLSGPYTITQGQNLLLNGLGSYDPDYVTDSISQYAWDLNGDATFDVFGATPDVDYATLAGLGMGAGTYNLALKVTDTHGTYGVSTTILTIAAVPEPETYAMMLAGLGLVGAAVRRRRAS